MEGPSDAHHLTGLSWYSAQYAPAGKAIVVVPNCANLHLLAGVAAENAGSNARGLRKKARRFMRPRPLDTDRGEGHDEAREDGHACQR